MHLENTANVGSGAQYQNQPATYKHKSIPNNLVGDELYKELDEIFTVLADNSAKIAPCGSTNDVESFHNMISSKAPKVNHYAASESLQARVGCAVAQKNLGQGYITKVCTQADLSLPLHYGAFDLHDGRI